MNKICVIIEKCIALVILAKHTLYELWILLNQSNEMLNCWFPVGAVQGGGRVCDVGVEPDVHTHVAASQTRHTSNIEW